MTNDPRRWSVEKRMEFVDFRLMWEGSIRRSDLTSQFGVSVPQASKDLGDYAAAAPDNMYYNVRQKRYEASPSFKPLFPKADPDFYFWQLRDDVRSLVDNEGWLTKEPSHDMVRMPRRHISSVVLRNVVESLNEATPIKILYQSMTEEQPLWRSISPHSFAFDGFRWHVRAFCHKREQYKDFLMSRILNTETSTEKYISNQGDLIWNEYFTLTLKPHPNLSLHQAEAVAQDYNMQNKRLEITIRLALLYYYLRRLGVEDCDGESRSEREQHIVVANKKETAEAYRKTQLSL